MGKTKKNFTEGAIFKPTLAFTIPIILTGVLQQLYSAADNIVVGKFSGDPLALAAVGTTTSISGLLLNLIAGLVVGAGVLVAQAVGAKNEHQISRIVHTLMSFSLILGVGLGVPAAFLSRPLLVLTKTPVELLDGATVYLAIIFLGFPACSVYNFATAILRSVGDSRTPLILLSASGVANVLLNLVFVLGFGMSVVGVALATVISQYASAAAFVFVLIRRKGQPYAFEVKKLRLEGFLVKRTVILGLPAGIQNCMFSFANLMITVAVNTLSTAAITAKAIFINLISIANAVSSSFAATTATFAGQNYGAKKYKRITKGLFVSLIQAALITLATCLTMMALLEPLSSLYIASTDLARADILAEIKSVGYLILPLYFLGGVMNALSGTLRGMGFSFFNMIISIAGICVFRIIWILTAFTLPVFHSLRGVYISWPISWGIVIVAFIVIYIILIKRLYSKQNIEKSEKC